MAFTSPIPERNRELARQINEEALKNPNSPYANKFVGLINGRVFVVGENMDEVIRQLREAEPDSRKCFVVEASRDPNQVEEIWGLGLGRVFPDLCRAESNVRGQSSP